MTLALATRGYLCRGRAGVVPLPCGPGPDIISIESVEPDIIAGAVELPEPPSIVSGEFPAPYITGDPSLPTAPVQVLEHVGRYGLGGYGLGVYGMPVQVLAYAGLYGFGEYGNGEYGGGDVPVAVPSETPQVIGGDILVPEIVSAKED